MSVNKVSAVLEQTVVSSILTDIEAIEAKLPFLITLTEKEKAGLVHLGQDATAFLGGTLDVVRQNPGMMPADFDVNEYTRDVNLVPQLSPIVQRCSSLFEKLTDTYREVLNEAYAGGLAVYAMAKFKGKNLGGMDSTLDNLGKRFAKKTGKTPPPAKP